MPLVLANLPASQSVQIVFADPLAYEPAGHRSWRDLCRNHQTIHVGAAASMLSAFGVSTQGQDAPSNLTM